MNAEEAAARELRRQARRLRARADWTPPGIVPPGDGGDPALVPRPGETLDAFAGHFCIFQLERGHRYSTDDLLAAWFCLDVAERLGVVPARALDLGCGIGSVGMFVVWRLPGVALTGVEIQPGSLDLARRTARWNGVDGRCRWIGGDLAEVDVGSGYDLVTGSPPYWDPAAGRVAEGPQKGPCRFELVGTVEMYCQAAARALAPEGIFGLVFDGRQRPRLEAAMAGAGLHPLRVRDVVSREGDPPLLCLAAADLGAHPTLPPEPPLLLRHRDGRRSDALRQIRQIMGLPPGPR